MSNKIKLFVCDVDGTLTDGKIYFGNDGEIFKAFDIKDGYGLYHLLPSNEIEPIVITGRNSEIVRKRCEDLRIKEVHQGISDKFSYLKDILHKKNMTMAEVAYIGDDLNDLICMEEVNKHGGMTACPQNAIKAVKEIAGYVCENDSGNGAVREFIDFILKV